MMIKPVSGTRLRLRVTGLQDTSRGKTKFRKIMLVAYGLLFISLLKINTRFDEMPIRSNRVQTAISKPKTLDSVTYKIRLLERTGGQGPSNSQSRIVY
jgi:hypothetical protein